MKLLLIAFVIVGLAAAAQLPDSATQGPNPQDIATPEPEYIDIDEPPPPAPAPAQVQPRVFAPVPIAQHVQRPVQTALPSFNSFNNVRQVFPQRSSFAPVVHHQQYNQLPGHSYSQQSGYQYRRPVYYRRVYRRRSY